MQKAERRTGADARFVACKATTDNTGLGLVLFVCLFIYLFPVLHPLAVRQEEDGLVDLSPPLADIFFSHHFDIDLKWAV